jgi:hypothetical protein
MSYPKTPKIWRSRPIVPAIAIAILTAGFCGITLFLILSINLGIKNAIGVALVSGCWTGAGAWALWAGWPMRRPRVGQVFVKKWAARNPAMCTSEFGLENYVRAILEAADVDVDTREK